MRRFIVGERIRRWARGVFYKEGLPRQRHYMVEPVHPSGVLGRNIYMNSDHAQYRREFFTAPPRIV